MDIENCISTAYLNPPGAPFEIPKSPDIILHNLQTFIRGSNYSNPEMWERSKQNYNNWKVVNTKNLRDCFSCHNHARTQLRGLGHFGKLMLLIHIQMKFVT